MRHNYKRRQPKPIEVKRVPRPPATAAGFAEIASRSTKLIELRLLWQNAKDMGKLTDDVKAALIGRAKVLNDE